MTDYISISMFGSDPRYTVPLPMTVCTYKTLFPTYTLVYYVEEADRGQEWFTFLTRLAEKGIVELRTTSGIGGLSMTARRFDILWDEGAGIVFCRDVDGLINTREYKSMLHFASCNPDTFYSYRSYYSHTSLLLAGMCGFKSEWVRSVLPSLPSCRGTVWGCDQEYVAELFAPHVGQMSEYLGNKGVRYAGNLRCPDEVGISAPAAAALVQYADTFYDTTPWGDGMGFENMPHSYGMPTVRDVIALSDPQVAAQVKSAMEGLSTWTL